MIAATMGSGARPGYRLFLINGPAVPILGEYAVVGDLVVSTVVAGAAANGTLRLQLVSLPKAEIDWRRTEADLKRVRRETYLATRAVGDYAALTTEVATALNDASLARDKATKLKIAQTTRQRAAAWPAERYGYRAADVRELVGLLDEVINEVQAPAGNGRFDLTFSANVEPLPAGGDAAGGRAEDGVDPVDARAAPQQEIAVLWDVARRAAVPAERISLAQLALADLRDRARQLPRPWSRETRSVIERYVSGEVRVERAYGELVRTMSDRAAKAARQADVRALTELDDEVRRRDEELGGRRPELVSSLLAALAARLSSARELLLAREHYAVRAPEFRRYRAAVRPVVNTLTHGRSALDDIKALAGPDRGMLDRVAGALARARSRLARVMPPPELRPAHEQFAAALTMATAAVEYRRNAVLAGSSKLAWDASAAAAGAQMLLARAVAALEQVLRQPGT